MNCSSERFLRNTYEGGGRHTKDLDDIRMTWSSERFFAEDVRRKWKTYEWIGVQKKIWGRCTNELDDIRMNLFLVGTRMNWKTYVWIGIHTNDLGFRKKIVEDVRMNWRVQPRGCGGIWGISPRMNCKTYVLKRIRTDELGVRKKKCGKHAIELVGSAEELGGYLGY
jgi:hypothetical protein